MHGDGIRLGASMRFRAVEVVSGQTRRNFGLSPGDQWPPNIESPHQQKFLSIPPLINF